MYFIYIPVYVRKSKAGFNKAKYERAFSINI